MEVFEKLTKQIDEFKYLTAENSYRYRPIMRVFYYHYERLEYWLYKEDVFRELKENTIFNDYTIEECERDLEQLTEWLSLTKMQDTKNANSIEEFKNKKFRYQMTEYATEIERLTVSLEEMKIKTSSLEPKLFDRIRMSITKMEQTLNLSDEEVNELWTNLNEDFTKLNENYQDFLKKFNEPTSEELLQSSLFLQFKSEIVKYLREFIQGYQRNIYIIKDSIRNINEDTIEIFLTKLNNHHKTTVLLNKNFDLSYFKEVNASKINSIFKWFINDSQKSEGEKLMDTTDGIIVKITKYASSLIDLRGNMTNRKEEYKHLCQLFDKLDINEAHKYAAVVFGIKEVRHFVGNSNLNTDSICNTYDIPPIEIVLSSRSKTRKEKVHISPIVDKTYQKQKQLEEYRKAQQENKQILKRLIKDKKITLNNTVNLSKVERKYIQKLLSSSSNQETEFGLTYNITKKDGYCKIISEDGVFTLNSLEIEFAGDING